MKKFFAVMMVTMSVMMVMAMGPKEALAVDYKPTHDAWVASFEEATMVFMEKHNVEIAFQDVSRNNDGSYTWAAIAIVDDEIDTDEYTFGSKFDMFATTWAMRVWSLVN